MMQRRSIRSGHGFCPSRTATRPGGRWPTRRLLAVALAVGAGAPAAGQTTQTFTFDNAITFDDIGRVGDPDRWQYDLGFDWDQDFSIGKIIGKKNAVIIPEVSAFGKTIIPQVTADTRTGARYSGNISGDTGLIFYADYDASGLEAGTQFSFAPTIDLPTQVRSGEFISLATSSGLIAGQSFNTSAIDLPSFEAGMDFYFNLALQSKFEAGLFPFGYTSTNFNPDPINVNQSLLKFAFDLDPDSNPDSNPDSAAGTPPTFTMFEDLPFEYELAFLDDSASVLNKQISVEVGVKDQPGVQTRLDIGEVQIVNPFGADTSIAGGTQTNLKLATDVTDSTIQYTAESALLRLGLDLDGIAAYLGTGQSFTRLDESEEGLYSIVGDFIDLKYGPEIGYRETVDINPELQATLTFSETVAIKDGSALSLTDTWTGDWSELPDISLLGLNDVEVDVAFLSVSGEQTKRGAFYLTDYLEFTLLELEELNLLDEFELSLPPVYRGRTSILGALLGEFELEVVNDTQAIQGFGIDAAQVGDTSFTLFAAPSEIAYINIDSFSELHQTGAWTDLATGSTPGSLATRTLYLATDETAGGPDSVADLSPMVYSDYGGSFFDGSATINAQALVVPEGAELYHQGGFRIWDVGRVVNDGLIDVVVYAQFGDYNDAVLQIVGDGEIRTQGGGEISFQAPIVLHGPDHRIVFNNSSETVNFDSGPLHFVSQFFNAGEVVYNNSEENTTAVFTNEQTGLIQATGSEALVELFNGNLTNLGVMRADLGAEMRLGGNTPTNALRAPGGNGQFIATTGGKIVFKGQTELGDRTNTNPALASSFTFDIGDDAEIDFEGKILQAIGSGQERTTFNIAQGGTLRLNGIEFPSTGGGSEPEPSAYSSFIDIDNAGTLIAESGRNFLFYQPDGPLGPNGGGSDPYPVVAALNLDNTGEIIIQNNAVFGFEVEIDDYSDGVGATLNGGTWTVIGANGIFSNLTNPEPYLDDPTPSSNVALLDISVVSVNANDTYLSQAGFSDTNSDGQINELDGYPLGTFDTDLAVNNATVTLSGRALFPYFNTVKENRGTLNLRNGQQFNTAGDLLNTGELNIESGAQLNVSGDFTIDEGVVNIGVDSGINVGSNTVEVIGGTLIRDFATPGTANVNTPWIVREKWVGEDANGNDIILPAFVDYTGITFPVIGVNGDITLDGEQARFVPIEGVNRVDGALRLLNGNRLALDQLLTIADTGLVEVIDGARLDANGGLTINGELFVDEDSFLQIQGKVTLGSQSVVRLDGVIDSSLSLSSAGAMLTGAGQLAGGLSVTQGTFDPGNSPGTFEVYGALTLGPAGQTVIEVFGDEVGVESDLVRVIDYSGGDPSLPRGLGDATLGGELVVVFGDEVAPITGKEWTFIQIDGIRNGAFDQLTTTLDGPLNLVNAPVVPLPGDAELIGSYDNFWNIYLTYTGGDGNDAAFLAVADLVSPAVAGDLNNNGVADAQDLKSFVQAVRYRSVYEKTTGLYPVLAGDIFVQSFANAVFDAQDMREAANTLPIVGTSIVIRKSNFIAVDQAYDELDDGQVNGSQINAFETVLATGKTYAVGDSRGDLVGPLTPILLPGPADGKVDALDIDFLFSVVNASGSGWDIDGDLDTDLDDIADLVQNILGTDFGDANLDGEIDDSDLLVVLNGFGRSTGWAGGDFNGDGIADIQDFNTAVRNFTATESAIINIPEPGTFAMLGIGLIGLTRRRSAGRVGS